MQKKFLLVTKEMKSNFPLYSKCFNFRESFTIDKCKELKNINPYPSGTKSDLPLPPV